MAVASKKSAITGADREKRGTFDDADGGLFLDEVHRLSAENQEKLFLLMDKGYFYRLASQVNPLGPLLFLLIYNIPSYLPRYYGGVMGYRLGSKYIAEATQSGLLSYITKASAMMGLMMVGAMSASMVKFTTTFKTTIAGQPFVLQEILDKICVGLIPLLLVLGCLKLLNKKVSPNKVLIMLIVFGFAAAGVGII